MSQVAMDTGIPYSTIARWVKQTNCNDETIYDNLADGIDLPRNDNIVNSIPDVIDNNRNDAVDSGLDATINLFHSNLREMIETNKYSPNVVSGIANALKILHEIYLDASIGNEQGRLEAWLNSMPDDAPALECSPVVNNYDDIEDNDEGQNDK
jgi:hypothetical protein